MNTYERITEALIERIEAGDIPWRKPWNAEHGMPLRWSGAPYRGINIWMLASRGFTSPTWLTFKQARKAGGSVRKGEKGTPVVFWKRIEKRDADTDQLRHIPVLKGFTVFNIGQCEGVDDPNAEQIKQAAPIDTDATCEAIVANYKGTPRVATGGGRACYSPALDIVSLPDRNAFESTGSYYSTLFHELAHSTGHRTRLKRDGICNHAAFGDHRYSREELVAEFAASFLCGVAGIAEREPDTETNSVAYLQGWVKKLRQNPKELVTAAAQAQRAVDWIQGKRYEKGEAEEQAAA